VEPQDVVLGQAESVDGCFIIDAGVWRIPVVSMWPGEQLLFSSVRVFVGVRIGPFAQAGLDKAFGLAVGLGCIGLGADVPQTETFAGPSEGKGLVAVEGLGIRMSVILEPDLPPVLGRCRGSYVSFRRVRTLGGSTVPRGFKASDGGIAVSVPTNSPSPTSV